MYGPYLLLHVGTKYCSFRRADVSVGLMFPYLYLEITYIKRQRPRSN